jgi:2-desacetyl-2-hydroxyethyl bacteriochlorophyllide A dehydrogenase
MKTAILNKPGALTIEERSAPDAPEIGEALIRVRRVGVCGTDFHAYQGKQPFFAYPRILGHELGVEVVAVSSDVKDLAPGDRCAVEPYFNCGSCIACRRGRPNCCVHLKVLGVHTDGGMREIMRVPAHKLHKSQKLNFEQLALVETLGIGAHAVTRAQIEAGEFALVIGVGPIGLSVIQFAKASGARIIALDTDAHRLDFCQAQFAVDHAVLSSPAALEEVRSITGGEMPTVVFDATGNQPSMRAAFDYVANGGRLVLVGLIQGDVVFSDPDFHRREMTLLSSRNSTAGDFRQIISLMEAGRIDTRPWVTHRSSIEELPTHLAAWSTSKASLIKGMVEIS